MSGTAIAQVINFALTVPLMRYYYRDEEFAEWDLYMRIVAFGAALATARYEFSIPVAKSDLNSYRLYQIVLRILLMVSGVILVGAIIPIIYSDSFNEVVFYSLIPVGVALLAYYSIGTNWAIRNKLFNGISYSKVANSAVGGGVKMLFGVFGFGYVGLIIGTVVGQFFANAWFLRDFFKARKVFPRERRSTKFNVLAKRYIDFPKVNLPHTLMDLSRDLIVAAIIWKVFDKAEYGLYGRSYQILRMPLMLAGAALSQVFFQRCADAFNRGEDILPMLIRAVKVLTVISIIPFTTLMFFGDDLFAWVFGEHWRGAGEYSQIMAPWFMLNFIASPISFLPLILSKQRQFFLIALLGAISMIVSLTIPYYLFGAGVEQTLLLVTITQVAYYLFVIFKTFQFIKQSKPA